MNNHNRLDYETAQRRRDILQLLNDDTNRQALDGMLQQRLEVEHRYRIGLAELRRDLAWLELQGLILVHRPGAGSVWIAELTSAGQDIALRRTALPGTDGIEPARVG